MEKVNIWCKTIALVSVLSSVLLMIVPECKSKKAFKSLLSFIMILVFISPFSEYEPDFSAFAEKIKNIDLHEKSYDDIEYYPIIEASETETEKYIDSVINNMGISGKSEVLCRYENEKIIISHIKIFAKISDENKTVISDEIKKISKDEFSVKFIGESYEQ